MSLTSLFARLAALPAVKRVSTVAPLKESLVIAGIEVARTGPGSEAALRRGLNELLERLPAAKVAVFATYGETISYLDRPQRRAARLLPPEWPPHDPRQRHKSPKRAAPS